MYIYSSLNPCHIKRTPVITGGFVPPGFYSTVLELKWSQLVYGRRSEGAIDVLRIGPGTRGPRPLKQHLKRKTRIPAEGLNEYCRKKNNRFPMFSHTSSTWFGGRGNGASRVPSFYFFPSHVALLPWLFTEWWWWWRWGPTPIGKLGVTADWNPAKTCNSAKV